MVSQWIKDYYYATLGKLSLLNYFRAKYFSRPPKGAVLHLGCGPSYIAAPGFVNIDGNLFRKSDLWLDITLGLPYADGSVDAVYTCHMLEHLSEKQVVGLLRECRRVLKSGGTFRMVVPDLESSIDAYNRKDVTYFNDFPDKRVSLGGRFNNYMLCGDQHRLMFDASFAFELLARAGFTKMVKTGPTQSAHFKTELLERMNPSDPRLVRASLFVEASVEAAASLPRAA